MSPPDERLRRSLIQQLESFRRSGVTHMPRRTVEQQPPALHSTATKTGPTEANPLPRKNERMPMPASSPSTPKPLEDDIRPPQVRIPGEAKGALALLQEEVSKCTQCSELASTRTQTVFGVGNPEARLCFFGEAPGANEDRQGEPFVGRAGKLLTDIIENGMGLKRSEIYILNVLKCRPPGNRNPAPEEISHCQPYFERQLEIIAPEFICCLGAFASKTLLQSEETIGHLRGRWHRWRGIPVIATYHPAYLLRNPSAKKATWEDIQMLMAEMGMKTKESH